MNLRERILNARGIESERMTIPEWGEIEIRSLTLRERAKVITAASANGDGKGEGKLDPAKLAAMLLIETVYDPATGQRALQETDRDALMEMNARVVDRVTKVAIRLAGLDEDTAKNGSGASGTTTTESPETSAAPSTSLRIG